ncbi:ribosomal RNA large subunit methyltransferase I [Dictyobacter vulcani]|uniref:Ribosomal RNA large subunit methyltransferase I n=1 Tax=Dictyobacter vulcani TaxID=2607529 RepID=A0A5J4KY14_9CHLR|nr:class I SAM-dependent rRNA methyltransferase [Dictyobacter vulcani]GER91457.1 ribosomal RNA large subunit methyltransferase I [Dictyobacter vulcani]
MDLLGALQQAPHWVENGGILDVKSDTGKFIARGYYNSSTDIAIRILTHDVDEAIDLDFLRRRIRSAVQLREAFDPAVTNAYRLINSEGDGLPGLVVDRYADILVAQIHTAGMDQLRALVIEALAQETGAAGILLRSDSLSRRREGLFAQDPEVVSGEVPKQVEIRENGVSFLVDPWEGQKTGFFLDQRDKREALRKYTRGKRVLNCFSYTGGFSVYSALNTPAAQTTSVDVSGSAIHTAKQIFTLNGLDPEEHQFVTSDVFEYLEAAWKEGELFDAVVLDPPAFAKTQGVRTHALKAYRRLNYLGMQVLKPGGILLTCSCSGVIGMDDLLGTISVSAQRLNRTVQVLESYTHGLDHPINIAMPETAYLKAVFCRIS